MYIPNSTACITSINLIPTVNIFFFVLCRTRDIASNAPNEPPMKDNVNNVNSLILYLCFTALSLSITKRIKVSRFITIIQINTLISIFSSTPCVSPVYSQFSQPISPVTTRRLTLSTNAATASISGESGRTLRCSASWKRRS